jgi:hypothetical protein
MTKRGAEPVQWDRIADHWHERVLALLRDERQKYADTGHRFRDERPQEDVDYVAVLDSAIEELKTVPGVRSTLRALVEKVHYTLNHPSMNGAMTMAWVHGMEYDGPTVKDEMLAAQRLLGMPDELPMPEYPRPRCALLVYPDGQGHDMSTAQIAFVGTGEECREFMDKYPDEEFVFAGNEKHYAGVPKWVPVPPHEPCAVTPEMIAKVREATALPISECKEMLDETHGNVRRSIRNLRELYQELVVVPQPPATSFRVTIKNMKRVAEMTGAPLGKCMEMLREHSGDVDSAVDRLLILKAAGAW